MSEEIAASGADLATLMRINAELHAALSTMEGYKRALEQAQERERLAMDAYDQQQSSYRELEALYQAMTERAVRFRTAVKRMSDLIGRAVRPPEIVYAAHEIAADVLTDPHPRADTPPPGALVPVEDCRAAWLCGLAARRLRRLDLGAVTLAERAVVEALAEYAIQAERESRGERGQA